MKLNIPVPVPVAVAIAILIFIVASGIAGKLSADEFYVSGGFARSFSSDFISGDTVTTQECGYGGYSTRKYECNSTTTVADESHNFGQAEAGVRIDAWQDGQVVWFLQHTSSLDRQDTGFNLIGVKFEHTWQIK